MSNRFEINKESENQPLNYGNNKIIKQNGKDNDESDTQSIDSIERTGDEGIAAGIVRTKQQTGIYGQQTGISGNEAGRRTIYHPSSREVENLTKLGADNRTDFNQIQADIGGLNQGNT